MGGPTPGIVKFQDLTQPQSQPLVNWIYLLASVQMVDLEMEGILIFSIHSTIPNIIFRTMYSFMNKCY